MMLLKFPNLEKNLRFPLAVCFRCLKHNYHTRLNSTFVVIGVKSDQDFYLSQFRKRQKVRLAFKKHRHVIVRMRIVQSANTSKLVARCCMTHLIRQKVTSVECEGGTDMCCDKVLSWCLRWLTTKQISSRLYFPALKMLFYLTLSIISNGQIRSNARDQSSLLDEQKNMFAKSLLKYGRVIVWLTSLYWKILASRILRMFHVTEPLGRIVNSWFSHSRCLHIANFIGK